MEFVTGVYRQDFGPLADRYLLHGDTDTVTARLTEYRAADAETVIFQPRLRPGAARRRHRAIRPGGAPAPSPGVRTAGAGWPGG